MPDDLFKRALADVAVARTARAVAMPTEADALRAISQAFQRLADLGWKDQCYAPLHTPLLVIEPGCCTIVERGERWEDGTNGSWWVFDAGDLYPSRPAVFKPLPASALPGSPSSGTKGGEREAKGQGDGGQEAEASNPAARSTEGAGEPEKVSGLAAGGYDVPAGRNPLIGEGWGCDYVLPPAHADRLREKLQSSGLSAEGKEAGANSTTTVVISADAPIAAPGAMARIMAMVTRLGRRPA